MRKASLQFGRVLLVVAVFFASGSHWALLQTVAWSTMVFDFSRSGSVAEAVAKTFDGKHPCQLCEQVRKGQGSEGQKDAPPSVVKVELFHEETARMVTPRPERPAYALVDFYGVVRPLCPTAPPPRRS